MVLLNNIIVKEVRNSVFKNEVYSKKSVAT